MTAHAQNLPYLALLTALLVGGCYDIDTPSHMPAPETAVAPEPEASPQPEPAALPKLQIELTSSDDTETLESDEEAQDQEQAQDKQISQYGTHRTQELRCSADIVGMPTLGVTGLELATTWTGGWGDGMQYQVTTEDPQVAMGERLSLELYYDGWWSPSGPAQRGAHTFEFGGEDYSECATCLTAGLGCEAGLPNGKVCEREFLVTSGRLQITENGRMGKRLQGKLENIYLIEVDIDRAGGSYVATPVEDGLTWCIDSHPLNLVIEDI